MVLTILKLFYKKSFAVNKSISGEVNYISTGFFLNLPFVIFLTKYNTNPYKHKW